jgi:hypothetical protein
MPINGRDYSYHILQHCTKAFSATISITTEHLRDINSYQDQAI